MLMAFFVQLFSNLLWVNMSLKSYKREVEFFLLILYSIVSLPVVGKTDSSICLKLKKKNFVGTTVFKNRSSDEPGGKSR